MRGFDEFEELEKEFSNSKSNSPKKSERALSSRNKKSRNGSEAENLFQLLTENDNIPGVELLSQSVKNRGGRIWSTIIPAILTGIVFLGLIIAILIFLYSSMSFGIIAIGISLFAVPFVIFGLALLGFGIVGIVDPDNHERILVRTWFDRTKGLIIIMSDVYDVKEDFFHDSELKLSVYVTKSDSIRIYFERPFHGGGSDYSEDRQGGRSVCICKDGQKSSLVTVLATYSFNFKGPAKQLAKNYSEVLGIPYLGEVKTKSLPHSLLD